MAKPEWGTKRACQGCGAKFYDLKRSPIVCPSCGVVFDPEGLLRSRRAKPAAPKPPVEKPAVAADAELEPAFEADVEDDEGADDDTDIEKVSEADDEEMIEDASELGEDKDDLSEVVIEEENKEER